GRAAEKAGALEGLAELVGGGAAEEAKVRCVFGDLNLRNQIDDFVEHARRAALEQREGADAIANTVDDGEAVFPMRDHLRDQRRRRLEVGVHHDDSVAGGGVESGGERRLMAEVSAEMDDAELRIFGAELVEDSRRFVR